MPTDPIQDPLNRVTTYTSDANGRTTVAHDLPGSVTWTTYDAEGRMIAQVSEYPTGLDDGPPDEPHIVG